MAADTEIFSEEELLREETMNHNRMRMLAAEEEHRKFTKYMLIVNSLMLLMSALYAFLLKMFLPEMITPGIILQTMRSKVWVPAFFASVINEVLGVISAVYNNKAAHSYLLAGYSLFFIGCIYMQHMEKAMSWYEFVFFGYALSGIIKLIKHRKSLDEIDYLQTQEGYPDFNILVYSAEREKYIGMREDYVEKQHEKYSVPQESSSMQPESETPADTENMGGLTVSRFGVEKWFYDPDNMSASQKREYEDSLPEDIRNVSDTVIEGISADDTGIPDTEYKVRGQDKYRPL